MSSVDKWLHSAVQEYQLLEVYQALPVQMQQLAKQATHQDGSETAELLINNSIHMLVHLMREITSCKLETFNATIRSREAKPLTEEMLFELQEKCGVVGLVNVTKYGRQVEAYQNISQLKINRAAEQVAFGEIQLTKKDILSSYDSLEEKLKSFVARLHSVIEMNS